MSVETYPLFLTVDGHYTGAHLGVPYRDIFPAGGLAAEGDYLVSEKDSGANMTIDIAAGAAWVLGDESATQPCYRCYNDATVNTSISAADGSDPRIDRVVLEVLDSAFAGVSLEARLRVIDGTPTSGASLSNLNGVASEPNNALTLAYVLVPASDTTISDAQIQNVAQLAHPHVSSSWESYTPTWTNLTVGNATQDFRFLRLGSFVVVRGSITFGSTTSMGNFPVLTLPGGDSVLADAFAPLGISRSVDTSASTYPGQVLRGSTADLVQPTISAASGTYTTEAFIATSIPFTWATGDSILMQFSYARA